MKAAVLGANSPLGRRIVLHAEEAGINVTSIVSSPADLAGNGPIIIKEPEELEVRELSRFHVLIDAVSIPRISSFAPGQEPAIRLLPKLIEAGTYYLGIGDCSLLYTDDSRSTLVADSDLAAVTGRSRPERERSRELFLQLQSAPGLRWTLFCPPLHLDTHGYGRGRFELCSDVLPMGLDGSSRITLIDFVSALIELLKVKKGLCSCITARESDTF